MSSDQRTFSLSSATDLPKGHTWKRPSLDDDQAVFEVMGDYDISQLGFADTTLEDARGELRDPMRTLQDDAWLVFGPDGRPLAAGFTTPDRPNVRVTVDPYVIPEADPVVWDWLLGRLFARAAEIRAELDQPLTITGRSYVAEQLWRAKLEAYGFACVRRYHKMIIELEPGADFEDPFLPEGVTLQLVDEADVRTAQAVIEDGFVGHFDFHQTDFDAWWAEWLASPGLDLTLWWLAYVNGEPAGGLLGGNRLAAVGKGYVHDLAVLPAYRGRGVAKALLRKAFAEFARRGLTAVELSVDSENATGATHLYEAVGMRVDREFEHWRATLDANGSLSSS